MWALSDIPAGEGFALVPCSHRSELPPPSSQLAAQLGVVIQPAMAAGDLLLVSTAAMHGMLPGTHSASQLTCSFISATAPPSDGSLTLPLSRGIREDTARPAWLDDLSPTARAVADPAAFRPEGSPIVLSDGARSWLSEPSPEYAIVHQPLLAVSPPTAA